MKQTIYIALITLTLGQGVMDLPIMQSIPRSPKAVERQLKREGNKIPGLNRLAEQVSDELFGGKMIDGWTREISQLKL